MAKIKLSQKDRYLYFLLTLIILAFIGREVFLATSFPQFSGQDEARHYNTVQWLTGERDYSCLYSKNKDFEKQDKGNLATYRFSQEIKEVSTVANLTIWRDENYHKLAYIPNANGLNENVITNANWTKEVSVCPPDVAYHIRGLSIYHWIGSGIETIWENSNILTRFYLVRIFSVLLGACTILFAYLAVTEAGLSRRTGLLIALLISLQPRLSIYTTNINYDALLIPFFSFFTYAGIRCINRGLTFSNLSILILAFLGTILTKATGLMLMGGLLFLGAWILFTKRSLWKQKIPPYYWILGTILMAIVLFLLNSVYNLVGYIPHLSLSSLFEYLGKSLPKIPSSSESFWGTMSWNESDLGIWFVYAIWLIEAVALYGLIRYFYAKETLSFLPAKSVALFCLTLLISLQLGVRFFDWRVFQETGSLTLGTPGRYFLPTIIAQFILIAIGLGALLKQKIALERVLVALAVIMLTFNLYTTWLIIIPRFYL